MTRIFTNGGGFGGGCFGVFTTDYTDFKLLRILCGGGFVLLPRMTRIFTNGGGFGDGCFGVFTTDHTDFKLLRILWSRYAQSNDHTLKGVIISDVYDVKTR